MKWIFSLLAAVTLSPAAFAEPAQVLLLRHGEKSESGGDQLSDKGWERAKALPSLLERAEFHEHGNPVAIYAQEPNDDQPSLRAQETVKPLAEKLKLKVNTDFARDDFKKMVKQILKRDEYDGKLVVVCWEHKVLDDIAAEFGVDPKPHYPGDEFDRAWLLTFRGDEVKFQDLPQKLLPGDKRN